MPKFSGKLGHIPEEVMSMCGWGVWSSVCSIIEYPGHVTASVLPAALQSGQSQVELPPWRQTLSPCAVAFESARVRALLRTPSRRTSQPCPGILARSCSCPSVRVPDPPSPSTVRLAIRRHAENHTEKKVALRSTRAIDRDERFNTCSGDNGDVGEQRQPLSKAKLAKATGPVQARNWCGRAIIGAGTLGSMIIAAFVAQNHLVLVLARPGSKSTDKLPVHKRVGALTMMKRTGFPPTARMPPKFAATGSSAAHRGRVGGESPAGRANSPSPSARAGGQGASDARDGAGRGRAGRAGSRAGCSQLLGTASEGMLPWLVVDAVMISVAGRDGSADLIQTVIWRCSKALQPRVPERNLLGGSGVGARSTMDSCKIRPVRPHAAMQQRSEKSGWEGKGESAEEGRVDKDRNQSHGGMAGGDWGHYRVETREKGHSKGAANNSLWCRWQDGDGVKMKIQPKELRQRKMQHNVAEIWTELHRGG
ncbi:hypothetical protein C8F01DRAFT_1077801 [Mycena amicta]|nr:hypothetical protein C8F01DRAFT_1077801 [Mycena amicta]